MTNPDLPAPALSTFARDAIREKAARELSALRSAVGACDDLASTRSALVDASAALTAFLGGLGAIAADAATIARAKKLRKVLDESRETADAIVEAVDLDGRRRAAEEKRDALMADLALLGIAVDAGAEPAPSVEA